MMYKLNKIVSLDLSFGMQHRELELESKAAWIGEKKNITLDRFMFKTGLLFKVF